MSHTYADVETFKHHLLSGTDAAWTGDDSQLLTLIEGASRRIDEWCNRSSYGSGFGPRTGTNTYDNDQTELDLDDDILAVTEATVDGTVVTDYTLRPRGVPQKHWAEFHSGGGTLVTIAGTFGYSNDPIALGTAAVAASGSATSVTIGGGSAYAGHTLLIGSQHLYVRASSGGTALTVDRAVNGTTGGTVTLGTAVSVYRYPAEVTTACLQLAQRRYRSSQAGLTGDFGAGSMPTLGNRDTETSILRSIAHLRRYRAR